MKLGWSTMLARLMMLLGVVLRLNSQAAAVHSDERVVFFPSLGWPSLGGWEVEVHGCVYEPEQRTLLLPLVRRALGIDDEELTPAEKAVFRERARLFLVDHEGNRAVSIQLAGETCQLSNSAGNGHFTHRLVLTNEAVRQALGGTNRLAFATHPATRSDLLAVGEIHFLGDTGLSVISDIDDTIKISEVRNRRELLRNTFCRPFQPVPGMAATYQFWASRSGAQFHYVSGSPWQLYLPLAEFIRSNGFPAGTFHLRKFSVTDESFLSSSIPPERFKPSVIEPILERFPKRSFVLVGDSGEKDPEIYGALARQYPKQINRILIRDSTGERLDAPRYQQAFAGLPAKLWVVFKEPSEILTTVP